MKHLRHTRNILKALGETHRLRILNLLSHGSLTVAEICEILGSEQSNVSKHLTKLRLNNIVSDKRQGQFVVYSLIKQKDHLVNDVISSIINFSSESNIVQEDLNKLRALKKKNK